MLWPFMAALSFGQTAAALAQSFTNLGRGVDDVQREPEWTTANRVILELATLRLREFGHGEAGLAPILIVAPLALHHATVADFAPGHSVIEALRKSSAARLFLIEWKSATAHMRDYTIDIYLADVNVVAEELGPADYVGLCQGGWLALVFAMRFPGKVRSLVLAGAPVDTGASASALTQLVKSVPVSVFEELVQQGEGRVLGKHVLRLWRAAAPDQAGARLALQLDPPRPEEDGALEERFLGWYAITVDLPGEYYLQVVTQVYRENQIANGRFVALGKAVDIATLTIPIFVLAGASDLIVAPEQALAVQRLATSARRIDARIEPCGHLSLFMGARTIKQVWPTIGNWIQQAAA